MLCSRYKQILFTKSTFINNVQFRCFVNGRFISKGCGVDGFWASLFKHRRELIKMNSVRYILRNLGVNRLWNAWSRGVNIANVVKRYKKDRGMREVIFSFRQTFVRPRTFFITATAAFKVNADEPKKPKKPPSCSKSITDEELENLLLELERIKELAKKTLYCENCSKRLVIDKQHPGVKYCPCKEAKSPGPSEEGWDPYMEAEDVIIWRKEYKPGQGLYAYKVYGKYNEVNAQDFAAVQVDGAYRKAWDAAVASLSVVERAANGLEDQVVLHWEVLWPRLFANRDYVYIRRHKEYEVDIKPSLDLFPDSTTPVPKEPPGLQAGPPPFPERPSVHSNAKRKAMESYSAQETVSEESRNKVYVIVSKSCTHASAAPTGRAIRVTEYWSHMLVATTRGADKAGMEFVLTYYDEPAVGGMPSGVAAWATGRAAPAYLARMRVAARDYADYRKVHHQDIPDFSPFHPERVSYSEEQETKADLKEEDMESSQTGPEMDSVDSETRDQATQTEESHPPSESKVSEVKVIDKVSEVKVTSEVSEKQTAHADEKSVKSDVVGKEEKTDKEEEQEEATGGWLRYLSPMYYFA